MKKKDEFFEIWTGEAEPSGEFPTGASEWPKALSRRDFLQLSTATLAIAGLGGCTRPTLEKIIPFVKRPESQLSDEPTSYSTHWVTEGLAAGVLITCKDGRPVKVEGHPLHPASLGRASAQQQASLHSLYDPARARRKASWDEFKRALLKIRDESPGRFVIISEISTSLILQKQFDDLKRQMPNFTWIQYEPLFNAQTEKTAQKIFGRPLTPVYDLTRAKIIVSLGDDIFSDPITGVRHAHDWSEAKPKLLVAESRPSITGASADERRIATPQELVRLASQLAYADASEPWVEKIKRASREVAFFCSPLAPLELQEICHRLNAQHGNRIVHYIPSPRSLKNSGRDAMMTLMQTMKQGDVETVLVINANPSYSFSGWDEAFQKVKNKVSVALYRDETSSHCDLFYPLAHPYETWSDAQTFDGSFSLGQPLIEPLFEGKSIYEVLSVLQNQNRATYEIFEHYKDSSWDLEKMKRGHSTKPSAAVKTTLSSQPIKPSQKSEFLTLLLEADTAIYDGRYHSNSWLQELPRPLTRLTWENVFAISPKLAKEKSLSNGQWIEVQTESGSLSGPVFIQHGQAPNVITATFGYGRSGGIGYNAFLLLQNSFELPVKIQKLKKSTQLAEAQTHHSMEGRSLVKKAPVEKVKTKADFFSQPPKKEAHAWAMTIDLDRCIGCGACVIACQSENNIPSVGREAVLMGRLMHWIRVDRYYSGDTDQPQMFFQPVPCMHCEEAPCEVVCPVAATSHGNGGLNQMIYNRCIGTRYCSNNCPYKVRRFNYLSYTKDDSISKMEPNPDVSVRPRGVMEKCTYCVQRIERTQIKAEREGRSIKDGEIKTACQATCPTHAIVFGDQNDKASEVAKNKNDKRNYGLLEELNTRPRTTYLAKERSQS